MRITICAYDAPNNIDGPTTWLKRLLPYLQERGVETRILFVANKVKNLSAFSYFTNLKFECKVIPAELFFEEQMQMILEDIAAHPPDVFIPNYFPVAGYANSFTKQWGIPSVMILHTDDDLHRALADEFAIGKKENSLSCIVVVSKRLYIDISEIASPHVRVECIAYGAPVPLQTTQWDGATNLKIVYLGRLNNEQKRIADVTRALCRATKEIPKVQAVIYGNGPCLEEVLGIIAEEGDGGAITYGGTLAVDAIQTTLLENHVFVLLSEYEGLPIALMEAMACGLVPICTQIESGIKELVTDKDNGLIVSDRNDQFAEAVKGLASDPIKWKALSIAARKTIKEQYDEQVCNEKWLDLLMDLSKQNTYQGNLKIPSVAELKTIKVRQRFLAAEKRMPNWILTPFIRFKKTVGRIKRNYLQ